MRKTFSALLVAAAIVAAPAPAANAAPCFFGIFGDCNHRKPVSITATLPKKAVSITAVKVK